MNGKKYKINGKWVENGKLLPNCMKLYDLIRHCYEKMFHFLNS